MGRLTRDPELRQTQSGASVANFSLAVDRDFKDKQTGEKTTDFIDIVAWRSSAEFVSRFFTKGRMAVVEGRLQLRDWTDRDGNNPMMKNNALKMLAEMLRTNGIASLRFDKRGIAKSSNAGLQEKNLRFEDYVNDVNDWVSYLKKDKRFNQVIVAGHSEGSQIGILAAGSNPEIGKVISLAGAGRPASQILRKQLAKQPQQILDMCNPILEKLEKGDTVGHVSPLLYTLFRPSVQPYLISCLNTIRRKTSGNCIYRYYSYQGPTTCNALRKKSNYWPMLIRKHKNTSFPV
mgnify:CR=1 FL=1